MSTPPNILAISAYDRRWHGFDDIHEAARDTTKFRSYWRRTSHSWAYRHKDEDVLWLYPMCERCGPSMDLEEACYSIGNNPFTHCEHYLFVCSRNATPYRRATA